MAYVTIAVEGRSDEPIAHKLLSATGHKVRAAYVLNGKSSLDRQLRGYNHAAKFAPWFVLRDLNSDAACPGLLVAQLLPAPSAQMQLQIAVRAAESWLIADGSRLAKYLSIPRSAVNRAPDSLENPKEYLVNLARRSRSRAVREDMVTVSTVSGSVGPAYGSRLIEFVTVVWDPREAAEHSKSLARCLSRLQSWNP